MDINIKINGIEDLTNALTALAKAIESHRPPAQPVQPPAQQPVQPPAQHPVQQPPVQPAPPAQHPVQQPPAPPVQSVQPVQPPAQPAQPVQQLTVQQPAQPAQPVQPPAPQQAAPQPVATSTAVYTLDDLARAAMTLMDKGMQPQLLQLLSQYGVDALPSLPEGQYGAFATALRGLGAQI